MKWRTDKYNFRSMLGFFGVYLMSSQCRVLAPITTSNDAELCVFTHIQNMNWMWWWWIPGACCPIYHLQKSTAGCCIQCPSLVFNSYSFVLKLRICQLSSAFWYIIKSKGCIRSTFVHCLEQNVSCISWCSSKNIITMSWMNAFKLKGV